MCKIDKTQQNSKIFQNHGGCWSNPSNLTAMTKWILYWIEYVYIEVEVNVFTFRKYNFKIVLNNKLILYLLNKRVRLNLGKKWNINLLCSFSCAEEENFPPATRRSILVPIWRYGRRVCMRRRHCSVLQRGLLPRDPGLKSESLWRNVGFSICVVFIACLGCCIWVTYQRHMFAVQRKAMKWVPIDCCSLAEWHHPLRVPVVLRVVFPRKKKSARDVSRYIYYPPKERIVCLQILYPEEQCDGDRFPNAGTEWLDGMAEEDMWLRVRFWADVAENICESNETNTSSKIKTFCSLVKLLQRIRINQSSNRR